MTATGNIFVIVAPSGAGKTTLVAMLRKMDPHVALSISYTTRVPREGEVDGQDYHFVDQDTFQKMITQQAFLEYAKVHGHFYGTALSSLQKQTQDIVLEIDWQGAQQVRQIYSNAISVFILPPSFAVLTKRLTSRGTDSAKTVAARLQAAQIEIAHVHEFDYVIVNQSLDDAANDLIAIVRAARLTRTQQQMTINTITHSFNK